MNGVHDMGGMQCYGAVEQDDNIKFHHEWERQVFALTLAMGATGTWNLDQSRAARESLPPDQYLSLNYYGIWLEALEKLLLQHELVDSSELAQGQLLSAPVQIKRCLASADVDAVLAAGAPVSRATREKPKFARGDSVKVANLHTPNHTRLPQYIKGRCGVIEMIHGSHVYPDSNALHAAEDPQWLYNISFDSKELWGDNCAYTGCVQVDCWEPYLEILSDG